MPTYTQILYHHIVFATNRAPPRARQTAPRLFRYLWGVIKNHNCHLYRIGGVEDHVHILSSLHPTVALADFIKDIQVASSGWIKEERVFAEFEAWQEGYAGLTHSLAEKDRLIEYIKGQEEHHRTAPFLDGIGKCCIKSGSRIGRKVFAVNEGQRTSRTGSALRGWFPCARRYPRLHPGAIHVEALRASVARHRVSVSLCC